VYHQKSQSNQRTTLLEIQPHLQPTHLEVTNVLQTNITMVLVEQTLLIQKENQFLEVGHVTSVKNQHLFMV
jgi:hypothetical protein